MITFPAVTRGKPLLIVLPEVIQRGDIQPVDIQYVVQPSSVYTSLASDGSMHRNTEKDAGAGVMAALLTCSMLILMGGAAVTPGLPGIEAHFPEYSNLTSFVITLPHLAVAIVGFLMGAVADRFGQFRTLVLSLLIFIATGTGSFFLDDIYSILVLRFLLGFGLAGIVCTVTSLIGSYYTGQRRIRMLGLQSASMGVGVLILEVLGGSLADMSWNAPFLVYLIAVPFLILVLLFVREPAREEHGETDDGSGKNDMMTIWTCCAAIFIGMIVIFVIPTKMPSYMENMLGVSATMMGLYLGFHGLGNALFSCFHRRLNEMFGSRNLIVAAFLILALALVLPAFVAETVPVCLATLIISGFAVGLIVPSVVNTVVAASSPSNRGRIMGIYAVFLNLGQFAISLISIPAFSAAGDSYPDMFVIFAAVSVVTAIVLAVVFAVRPIRKTSAC